MHADTAYRLNTDSEAIGRGEFDALMAALPLPGALSHIAVAVSGGADSMALLCLARIWALHHHTKLSALVVDHGLRPESADEAAQVKTWAQALGVPCDILTPDHPITGGNTQAWARDMRYRLMADWCRAHRADALLVAHHAQDQLETMLMRLVRASGVEGLAAMRPLTEKHGIPVLRPLLSVTKQQLIATLQASGQAWLEDPSNQSERYTRNRLRQVAETLMEEGLSADRIATVSKQLADTSDFLAERVADALNAHVTIHDAGYADCPLDLFATLPGEIGWRVLRTLLATISGEALPVRSDKLMPLYHLLVERQLYKPRTLGGCLLVPDAKKGRLFIGRELAAIRDKALINKHETKWDGRFAVAIDGVPEQKMWVDALGESALAELQLAVLPAIPKAIMATFPALWGVDGLLAVPHINYSSPAVNARNVRMRFVPAKPLAGRR